MNVGPFAVQAADASMLVNVPRLVSAYYTERPDPSVPCPNSGSPSGLRDIAGQRSPRHSTNGTPWPSPRPFAFTAGSTAFLSRVYRATVPAARPATDFTARVMPQRSGIAVPLESAHILWQR
jgi:hypothetical protein